MGCRQVVLRPPQARRQGLAGALPGCLAPRCSAASLSMVASSVAMRWCASISVVIAADGAEFARPSARPAPPPVSSLLLVFSPAGPP